MKKQILVVVLFLGYLLSLPVLGYEWHWTSRTCTSSSDDQQYTAMNYGCANELHWKVNSSDLPSSIKEAIIDDLVSHGRYNFQPELYRNVTGSLNGYEWIIDLYTLVYTGCDEHNTCHGYTVKLDLLVQPEGTLESCQLYAVHDGELNNSQFLTFNPSSHAITSLGPIYPRYDIEALDLNPHTNVLYAASGDNTSMPGHIYRVNKFGTLENLGATGLREIDGLSFNPDGTLWGWAQDQGLFKVTSFIPLNVELVLPYTGEIEDIAWSNDGVTLYGVQNLHDHPDPDLDLDENGFRLLSYNIETGNLTTCDQNLGYEPEALEMLPNGNLLVGLHGRNSVFQGLIITTPPDCISYLGNFSIFDKRYNDIEGLAWPTHCTVPE